MYVKVLLWLSLANIVKKINAQSSTCGQPTLPYGSTIIHPLQQNQHNSGSVVLFGCKEGFYLVGMPVIRCTGSTWTTIKFRCLGFCPEFGHILNGQVVHVTPKVGQATVRFHCNKTHRLIGKPRLECINGRWNGALPFCEKLKSCAPLSTPANGTLHGSNTSHGAKASFSCLTGFDLFGSPTLTCSNGVWNAITPTCKAQCQKITDPLNGRKYGTRFSHGAIASFECNGGYELVGSRSLLCVVGKWNASVPVCNVVAMLCPRPSIPPNSYIIYPGIKDNYVHGIKLFLGCRNGYYLTGSPIMDCNQTLWSKVEFRCIAKCPVLGQLKNGIITLVTLRNGGEVEIKCLTNYTLDGSSKIFCRNGKWSDSLPICGAPCGEPVTPHHGRRLGRDFMHGHSVRFYCNRGYHRVGASSITCNDGKWDKQLPLCKGICGRPRTLHGVRLHGNSYLDGDRVTFSCDKNLDLFGKAKLRCVGRAWDSPVPECKECGSQLHASSHKSQFVSHPSYGDDNYKSSHRCLWLLTARSGHVIFLRFKSFDVEHERNCGYDYVEIYDGSNSTSPKLGKICGSESQVSPRSFMSSGNRMFIQFRTDLTNQKKGFVAEYWRLRKRNRRKS